MSLYWFRFAHGGGLPVRFPAFRRDARRFRWTGLYGVQIGSWFIGAIKGSVEAPAPSLGGEGREG